MNCSGRMQHHLHGLSSLWEEWGLLAKNTLNHPVHDLVNEFWAYSVLERKQFRVIVAAIWFYESNNLSSRFCDWSLIGMVEGGGRWRGSASLMVLCIQGCLEQKQLNNYCTLHKVYIIGGIRSYCCVLRMSYMMLTEQIWGNFLSDFKQSYY